MNFLMKIRVFQIKVSFDGKESIQTRELSNLKRLVSCRSFLPLHPRVISSVGLEYCLDRAGVTGSNPVLPTKTE